ncbi:uncharacterized protein Hap1MRO34_002869 [Clarias gariepinus]
MMDELQRVEEKIEALELKYRYDTVHSGHVTSFCNSKREDLKVYRDVFEPQVGDVQPVTGEVKSDMVAVTELVNETLHRAAVGEAELQRVKEEIKDLEQKYSGDSKHSGDVSLFCYSKREEMRLYREVFITRNTSLQTVTQELKKEMAAVDDLIKTDEGEKRVEMWKVLEKLSDLQQKYNQARAYYTDVLGFFSIKRVELRYCKKFYEKQKESTENKEVETEMAAVDDLIKKVLHPPPGEQEEVLLDNAERKIDDMIKKYRELNLNQYWVNKSRELCLCRKIYKTQKVSQPPEEVMIIMEGVYGVIREYKHRSTEEVEKKINDLEQKCRENRDYYRSVESFWERKSKDLELGSKLGLIELKFNSSTTEKEMETVVKILNELKQRTDQNHTMNPVLLSRMYTRASSSLKWITDRRREQRDHLKKFKGQLSPELRDSKIIHNVERHLRDLDQCCIDKEYELNIYNRKLERGRGGGGGSSNVHPQTSRSKGGEDIPLLEVKTEQK